MSERLVPFAKTLRACPGIGKIVPATVSKDRINERVAVFKGDFVQAMMNEPSDEPKNFVARFYSTQGFD
jgi:hypothetical protein